MTASDEAGDASARGTLREELASDLAALSRAGLVRELRAVTSRSGAIIECEGRSLVDFSSNDYLGLASDMRLAEVARRSLGAEPLGAAAARLVSGNHPLHQRLESELAEFKGSDAALLFSSGYAANIGSIPALVGRRDVVYADELNHASLIDACRLSRAELRVLPHCDVAALRQRLRDDTGAFRRSLVVVDAVFSMDGDLYPLDELVTVAREFGAWTYVDDAHGTGVLGDNGRGAAEQFRVEGDIDVLMGTLGKALGVAGAFVAGSHELIRFLLNRARSFVFTTGTPPHLAAATLEALRIVREEPWRRDRVRENARRLREGLRALGHEPPGSDAGHIVPVLLFDSQRTMRVGAALQGRGFLVGAIRPPTVAMGKSRLRITVSAAHKREHIDGLLAALRDVLQSDEVASSAATAGVMGAPIGSED